MSRYFHSVRLQNDLCKGCTNCIKNCPTEAIRVQKGKAKIMAERCIDCGECIRICPYKAKKAVTDSLDSIYEYKYKIAIPAPTLYVQFKNVYSRKRILSALLKLGFDDVFEVAIGAEYVSLETKKYLTRKDIVKPVISSACPAVVRLVQVKFPSLIPNLMKLRSPMETAAIMARSKFANENSVSKEDIGVFFISPCAAKMTTIKSPYEDEHSNVDGVLAIKTVFFEILKNLNNITVEEEERITDLSSNIGINWANSGGESLASGTDEFLAVDGINNVTKILEEVEGERLKDITFIEALGCIGGCLGGPLTIENLYVAKSRMNKLLEFNRNNDIVTNDNGITNYEIDLNWKKELLHKDIMKLDEDINIAIQKIAIMNEVENKLPGLDCGACGSPSCKSLAEDIVRGFANITDCIFVLRSKVRELANEMMELESKMPPVLDKD